MYQHLTFEECIARYPRLVAAIQRCGVFSLPEAGCAIRDYRSARQALTGAAPYPSSPHDGSLVACHKARMWGQDLMRYGGGEAVSHYGGPRRVIQSALHWRKTKTNCTARTDR